jgi:hypothetical protein
MKNPSQEGFFMLGIFAPARGKRKPPISQRLIGGFR